jgi:hypothetical protein
MSGLFDQLINYSPPSLLLGTVTYKGTWSAATNTPTLTNPPSSITNGNYYVVDAAGTQFGLSFNIGDWIISNGAAWEKVDNTDAVSSVFGRMGAVVGVSTDYSAVGITNTALGASNPSTVAATTITATSTIAATGAVTGSNLSGTNTGDQTIALTGDVTGSGTGSFAATLATVNPNVGSFGSATAAPTFTVNGKGLLTAAGSATVTPAVGSITGLGTGVATFLGTPSSANLAAAVTDETGTGALVFASSPTLVTPALGAATATSLTVNDNTTLGSSNSDTVDFKARVASDINPATDNTYDLGVTGHEWRNLNIDGTANIDSLVADTADINGGTIDGTAIGGSTAAAGAFTTLSSTTGANFATSSGSVGIGTASPADRLHVGGSSPIIRVEPSTATQGATTRYINTGGTFFSGIDSSAGGFGAAYSGVMWHGGAYPLLFGTSNTERLRIDSSGNVGIGTASPAQKLSVSGTVGLGVGSTTGFSLTLKEHTAGAARDWSIRDDAGIERLRFARGGSDQAFWDVLKVSASDQTGQQIWYTNGAARMALTSTGLDVVNSLSIGNTVNTVTATLPNRTITMVIGGTTYYIHAKTTND